MDGMIIAYLLVIVSFLWLVIASIFDIKTREVPDLLSYSLIAIGLGLRVIGSLVYWRADFILYGLLGFGVFFCLANIMYYTRQWGGGDAKLLIGLGAVFGSYLDVGVFNPKLDLPFLIVFLINVLIAGAVYNICWGIGLGIKHRKKVLIELQKLSSEKLKCIRLGWIGFIAIVIFSILFLNDVIFIFGITLGVLVVAISYLIFFMKIVERVGMQKLVPINKLTEGDWLVNDVKIDNRVVCRAAGLGLKEDDIANIKKAKIKGVLIKEGVPFVPSFLIGLILSVVWGNLLFYLF